jgi:hypothetical protein
LNDIARIKNLPESFFSKNPSGCYFISFLFLSCKNKDEKIGKPHPYILTENHISEDSVAYQCVLKMGNTFLILHYQEYAKK